MRNILQFRLFCIVRIAELFYIEAMFKTPRTLMESGLASYGVLTMITLSDDEVALLRAILTSLRSIKVREIDRALVILSKGERQP
ncbi:hypothetical protein C7B76_15145 [filamentous cyanobacterium CCP2]|nr:hypothetical protein C7B76_15145 [filamentous cyanobacterium CCP2]